MQNSYMACEVINIVNNVVCYIYRNNKRASATTVIDGCVIQYDYTEILDARKYLVNEARETLLLIDKKVVSEADKARKGPNKSRTMVEDIAAMLKVMGKNVIVSPTDDTKVPLINPESLLSESVVTRINELEESINILEKVI